jgi:hypothetical protein
MRHLLIGLSLLIATTLSAQHFIDLRMANVQGEGWPPDHRAHSFIVDSVLVTFDPAAPIGEVHKGIGNRRMNAFVKGSLTTELKALLDRVYTGDGSGRHIVLKVDQLHIDEQIRAMSETVFCSFAADVLEHTDTGWVKLYSFGTTLAANGGIDATDNHAENIAHALDNCLRRTAEALRNESFTARMVTEERLHTASTLHPGTRVPRGIYYSFMDVRDATPDTTLSFDLKETDNSTTNVRMVEPRGARWSMKAWGISDGERLYVNTGKEYAELKITREGLHTYFSLAGVGEEYVVATALFGALGAMAMANTAPNEPVRMDVDPRTGALRRHFTASGDPSTSSKQYFCFSRHSSVDTTVCLFLYGGDEACLKKGQYHVVRLTPRVEKIPLEIKAGSATIKVDMDTNANTEQVYLINLKKDDRLTVDLLNPDMAAGVLDKLRSEDLVK